MDVKVNGVERGRKMKGRCRKCGKEGEVTRHSVIGGHVAFNAEGYRYVYLCRECHDKEHKIKPLKSRRNSRTQKGNLKFAKGTKRR